MQGYNTLHLTPKLQEFAETYPDAVASWLHEGEQMEQKRVNDLQGLKKKYPTPTACAFIDAAIIDSDNPTAADVESHLKEIRRYGVELPAAQPVRRSAGMTKRRAI